MTTIPYIPDDEFELVSETRGKLQMDEDGDSIIAVWEGFEDITDPNKDENGENPVYTYANFRDQEHGAFAMSASYQLKQQMSTVPVGKTVRLTRTGSTEMRKGNPMIHFRVEVKRGQ